MVELRRKVFTVKIVSKWGEHFKLVEIEMNS